MKKIFVHNSSYIDKNVFIGDNTKIWHFSHIQSGAKIGKYCTLGQNVYIGENVIIGNNVKIQNNVSVFKNIIIEDNVFIGPSVVFTNVINPRSFINKKDEFKDTIIKTGSSIGANATVICGNIIGNYSLVGAASVITKNILNYALVYGNPAKQRGWVCTCGCKLESIWKNEKFYCKKCEKKYKLNKNNLELLY